MTTTLDTNRFMPHLTVRQSELAETVDGEHHRGLMETIIHHLSGDTSDLDEEERNAINCMIEILSDDEKRQIISALPRHGQYPRNLFYNYETQEWLID